MTTHRRILGRSFAQQFFNGQQALLGNHGLPGVVANAIGEGVEYPPCSIQGFFLSLGDKGDHHGYLLPFFSSFQINPMGLLVGSSGIMS